jgi:hypothetical protein
MATIDIRGAIVSAADPPIGTDPNPDLAIKAPVRAATTGANITLNGLQTIDSVALAAGDRVLVKDQTDATTNGIYNAQTGPWTRAIDGNNNSQWTTGTQAAVAAGAVNAGNSYKLTATIPVVLGTSLLTFALVTAAVAGGANPTAKVGLAAVTGTALTFMRSDGAPPIDETITPTWSSLHTFAAGLDITPSGLTPGITVTQASASGTATSPDLNSISIADSINAGSGAVDGVSIFHGFGGAAAQGARQALQVTVSLNSATSPTNPNRNYVAIDCIAVATVSDGGGSGTEKGSMFAINPVVWLQATATHMAEASGGEVDTLCASGSSVLDKYGWKVTQLSTDAVAGSRNDAALFFGNQGGAVGWGTLIQVGDGLNASPLTTAGSVLATKGSPSITNGIDLSGATIAGSAFKSPGFNVDGSGNATVNAVNKVAITAPATSATLTIGNGKTLAASNSITLAGTDATTMTFPSTSATIARTDAAQTFTGVQTFSSPLTAPGITAAASANLSIGANGVSVLSLNSNNLFPTTDNTASLGAPTFRYTALYAVDVYTDDASFLMRTIATLANGAGSGAGTLSNAPSAGNPTKWIGVDDNGTTRHVPAW